MGTQIEGLIFDLDGVLVDTAKYHFLAWRNLANSLGIDFSKTDNEQLKGVSRRNSIDKILTWGNMSFSESEIEDLMKKKNQWYLELMGEMNESEILPGALKILKQAQEMGLKIALGSASKNAPAILDMVKITHFFNVVIDGNVVTKSKPDPEVFVAGARAMGIENKNCLVFEDATAGIEAAINGGMIAVGIGDVKTFNKAHLVLEGFDGVDLKRDILKKVSR